MVTEDSGIIKANRDYPNEWEKFEFINHGFQKFSLKTWKGTYMDCES